MQYFDKIQKVWNKSNATSNLATFITSQTDWNGETHFFTRLALFAVCNVFQYTSKTVENCFQDSQKYKKKRIRLEIPLNKDVSNDFNRVKISKINFYATFHKCIYFIEWATDKHFGVYASKSAQQAILKVQVQKVLVNDSISGLAAEVCYEELVLNI